jgi:hypothetical protein
LNAFRHGLAGAFLILSDEVREDFDELYEGLRTEHQPQAPTEILLVESMAQHYWMKQRALRLQTLCFDGDEKSLALYLRYQTTHERAFHKALDTLVKLRTEKRKAEIGFVSQQSRAREQAEKAQQRTELNQARIRLANAKAEHLEVDSDIRQTIEAPLPGHMRIPFDQLSGMFRSAIDHVSRELTAKEAA